MLETTPQIFYPVEQILQEVERKITDCTQIGQAVDYLSLVPDGEPTLDVNLGKLIEGLKRFAIPIAVISNAALIDNPEIQDSLSQADWVSLKIDAVDETIWRQINRSHHRLSLISILTGIQKFRSRYHGELVTETMLIAGINESDTAIRNLSSYLLLV